MSRRANVVRHGGNHAKGGSDPVAGLVPAGGTTDQVLAKLSGTDYDYDWADAAAGGGGVAVYFGSGSPEGVVTGNVGDVYVRSNGQTATTVYEKTSGTGNTGWTARTILGGGIVEADQLLSDVTTANVSTSAHGYVPKAPNDVTKWLRGDATWSVIGWSEGWDGVVAKSADESVASSTTLQNDDHLFFTVTSGGMYVIEVFLIYAGSGTTCKIAYGEDTVQRGVFGNWFISTAPAGSVTGINSNQGDTTDGGVSLVQAQIAAQKQMVYSKGVHYGNGGTFRVLWAQGASNVTAATVYAGSFLRYKRVY